jgi:hypothetical protein
LKPNIRRWIPRATRQSLAADESLRLLEGEDRMKAMISLNSIVASVVHSGSTV